MCTVCFREDFFRFLEGVNRIFNKKTFPEPLYNHDGRVICAAQHCKMLHVQDLAVHKPFSGSCNSLRGTKYFLRETMNSLRGTNIVFRDTSVNSLRGTKYFLRETRNSLRGTSSVFQVFGVTNNSFWGNSFLWESMQSLQKTRETVYNETQSNTTFHGCYDAVHVKQNSLLDTDMCLEAVPGMECDNIALSCKTNTSHGTVNINVGPVNQGKRHSRPCVPLATSRVRDREPSRVSLKRVFKSLKHRKLRKNCKLLIRKSVPVSSVLYRIANHFKQWNSRFAKKQDSFYSKYFLKCKILTVKYNSSERQIFLSGDIESNPGPTSNNIALTKEICSTGSDSVFNDRLRRQGLRPLEVGGMGNCLFRAVAHQLYNDASRHLEIRSAGVQYLQNNPERFIESVLDMTWSEYISSMSMQGTWADHIIIQAIADTLNLKIHIVESSENFADITLVEPPNASHNSRSIFIGHIGELHYISTVPILCQRSSSEIVNCKSIVNDGKRKYNDVREKESNQ